MSYTKLDFTIEFHNEARLTAGQYEIAMSKSRLILTQAQLWPNLDVSLEWDFQRFYVPCVCCRD